MRNRREAVVHPRFIRGVPDLDRKTRVRRDTEKDSGNRKIGVAFFGGKTAALE